MHTRALGRSRSRDSATSVRRRVCRSPVRLAPFAPRGCRCGSRSSSSDPLDPLPQEFLAASDRGGPPPRFCDRPFFDPLEPAANLVGGLQADWPQEGRLSLIVPFPSWRQCPNLLPGATVMWISLHRTGGLAPHLWCRIVTTRTCWRPIASRSVPSCPIVGAYG